MFAIVSTGGKQYKVAKDSLITVEKLEGNVGDKVVLDQVLALGDEKKVEVGAPTLEGKAVSAEIIAQERGEKVIIFKKKRRHNYRRKNGHRQYLTTLKVLDLAASAKAPAKKAAAKKADEAPKAEEKKTAAKKPAAKKPAAKKAD